MAAALAKCMKEMRDGKSPDRHLHRPRIGYREFEKASP
jgi:hypothetical protein